MGHVQDDLYCLMANYIGFIKLIINSSSWVSKMFLFLNEFYRTLGFIWRWWVGKKW